MLKYTELISTLKQGKIRSLYLLYGEEEFLIQEAVDLIIKKVVDPGARDFNFNTFYGREISTAQMVSLCQTLPFMSGMRLVIIKDFDQFKTADLEELLPYLNDPSPSTCLVLVSNEGRYEKKQVISAVEAHGVVTRFFPLLEREIVPWIEGRARLLGLTVQRDAANCLWQAVGNDLQKLGNELEKVALYVKEKKAVGYEDMKTVVGDFKEYSSFDLAAAIGVKNREKAFLILARLIQEGEASVALLASIAWNFRRLLQVKSLEASGMPLEDAMKKLRPPVIFHQAAQFKTQAKSYSLGELRTAFEVMLNADKALKSTGTQGKLVLERMILRFCGA